MYNFDTKHVCQITWFILHIKYQEYYHSQTDKTSLTIRIIGFKEALKKNMIKVKFRN